MDEATLVAVPLLDEGGKVLGVLVVETASPPSSSTLTQLHSVAALAACGLRSWVEAVHGRGGDHDDEEEAVAGIATPSQLKVALSLAFSSWGLRNPATVAATTPAP